METTRALLFLAGEVLGFGAATINGIGDLADFLDDLGRGLVDPRKVVTNRFSPTTLGAQPPGSRVSCRRRPVQASTPTIDRVP
jgi:hypothetical protein